MLFGKFSIKNGFLFLLSLSLLSVICYLNGDNKVNISFSSFCHPLYVICHSFFSLPKTDRLLKNLDMMTSVRTNILTSHNKLHYRLQVWRYSCMSFPPKWIQDSINAILIHILVILIICWRLELKGSMELPVQTKLYSTLTVFSKIRHIIHMEAPSVGHWFFLCTYFSNDLSDSAVEVRAAENINMLEFIRHHLLGPCICSRCF